MSINYKCVYNEENKKIEIKNIPNARLLEYFNASESKQYNFEMLHAYILHKEDIRKVLNYTDIYEKVDQKLIKDAIFDSAIITLVRCFTKGKEPGRIPIKIEKVVAKTRGGDPKGVFDKFEIIRNKFIAHDQDDYQNMKLGVVIDDTVKHIYGVCCPSIKTNVNYLENIMLIRTLAMITLEYLDDVIEKELQRADKYVKSLGYEVVEKFPEFIVSSTSMI